MIARLVRWLLQKDYTLQEQMAAVRVVLSSPHHKDGVEMPCPQVRIRFEKADARYQVQR
jgi:hypothetical protein